MVLIVDNYDSFTYNLLQRIGELDPALPLRVVRNDKITVAEAEALAPAHVIISPGPCTPHEGGVSNDMIRAFAGRVPLLGVCLGHECIAEVYGLPWGRAERLMHGKTSRIHHDGEGIFSGLESPFEATRYHSLIVDRAGVEADPRFTLSAWTDAGEVMGLRAAPGVLGPAPLEGVQFHPESFLTGVGPGLLARFLNLPAPDRSAAA